MTTLWKKYHTLEEEYHPRLHSVIVIFKSPLFFPHQLCSLSSYCCRRLGQYKQVLRYCKLLLQADALLKMHCWIFDVGGLM
jgi:hypothetical protein